jgi:esterase
MHSPLFFHETGSGPPMIILHGFLGSGENWLGIAMKFAENFHVFLPDQRNHGRSLHSDEFNYDLLAEDLKDFADARGAEKFYLVGHSMGGKVAMQFARKYPARIQAMVVADIAPRAYAPHHQTIFESLKTLNPDLLSNRREADELLAPFIPEMDVRQFLLKNLYRKAEGGFAWRFHLPALEKAADSIGEDSGDNSLCSVPVLFIRGGLSSYIRKEDEAEIYRRFPSATIITIEGAGHWVHAEKPEEVASVIQEFFVANSSKSS